MQSSQASVYSGQENSVTRYNFSIKGTGVSPEISVQQSVINVPDNGPGKNFGNVRVGDSASLVFVIFNTGAAELIHRELNVARPGRP